MAVSPGTGGTGGRDGRGPGRAEPWGATPHADAARPPAARPSGLLDRTPATRLGGMGRPAGWGAPLPGRVPLRRARDLARGA